MMAILAVCASSRLTEIKAALISLCQHRCRTAGTSPIPFPDQSLKFAANFFRVCALLLCLAPGMSLPVRAQTIDELYPAVRTFFPQADRCGGVEGDPPAAAVYRGDELLGHAYLTDDIVRIPAYSGHPINTLVGFDVAGKIVGIRIVEHQEPILVVGISEERLQQFVGQYRGKSVFDRVVIGAGAADDVAIDAISGATITVMVENATLMRSLRRVAESRGLTPALPAPSEPRPAAGPTTATSGAAVEAPASSPAVSKGGAGKPRVAAVKSGYIARATGEDEPIWVEVWRKRTFQIAVLVAGLSFLTLVLVFQDWLAKRPRLLVYVRNGFLLYTIFFIGWVFLEP